MTWAMDSRDGVVLSVRIVPRASRTEVAGPMGEALKVRIQAPPVDGKANAALIDFLASALGVPRRGVTILSGRSSRLKKVRVTGLDAARTVGRLCPPGAEARLRAPGRKACGH